MDEHKVSESFVTFVCTTFEETNSLCAVTVSKDDDIMTQLGTCHRSMTQARAYLDSEYELTNINELL